MASDGALARSRGAAGVGGRPSLARGWAAVAVLLLASLAVTAGERAHPQDGPHADVRISILDESVRFNVLMNLVFVDEIVDAAREQDGWVHEVEQDGLHEALFDHYREVNLVTVDGVEVTPVDSGFEVTEPDMSLLPLFPITGTRGLVGVRLVLEYPVKTPPRKVSMVWGSYPPNPLAAIDEEPPPLEITARLDVGGRDTIITFRAEEPEYTWHGTTALVERFLPVPERGQAPAPPELPLLSLGLALLAAASIAAPGLRRAAPARRRARLLAAPLLLLGAALTLGTARVPVPASLWAGGGAGLPGEEEALAVFAPLHANIYRAFDYTEESDVYDALARSVDGDLLEELYDEIYQSLILQEEGGAVCRVQEVDLLESEVESIGLLPPDDVPGFAVVARWQVMGSVYHWGHAHSRTNEYRARYAVELAEPGWRIAGSRVLEQSRVDSAPIPGETGGEPEALWGEEGL